MQKVVGIANCILAAAAADETVIAQATTLPVGLDGYGVSTFWKYFEVHTFLSKRRAIDSQVQATLSKPSESQTGEYLCVVIWMRKQVKLATMAPNFPREPTKHHPDP